MSSIGPELPPHLLAKRKRKAEEAAAAQPTKNEPSRSSSPDGGEKRRRVIGPAPPPAPLDELPPQPADEDGDSSSDDDFGPAPLLGDAATNNYDASQYDAEDNDHTAISVTERKSQRDEWMMIPPKQDDLAARMDPTKMRARKFNTGKGAKAPNQSSGPNEMWTETPEQKRKRLENQVLGITEPVASGGHDKSRPGGRVQDEETARRIREHNEKIRGPSLLEQHKATVSKDQEDDPSKRAFDREKDIVAGTKISHAQRKEMLNRAADFGSRFSGGGYL